MKWTLLLLAAFVWCSSLSADERPNFVVILCDDLGWGDLENYGHPHIETPHLMKLASEGIQFSDFYSAAPVCSPSRVGLLTGRIPSRAGVYDWIPSADQKRPVFKSRQLVHMREEEFTIAEMLKGVGYATCLSGKWHCNAMFNSEKQAQPHDHGFDHWFATQNNASPSHENPKNFVRNGQPAGELEGFSCEIVADEAIGWLKTHQEKSPDQPFFLYLAYHEPHEPVASPADLVAKYEAAGARNHDEAQYFANVENLDRATGKLVDAIDELGYGENTIILFTSDNGPETLNRYRNAFRSYGVSGKLQGMKLYTYEAGARVAGILRWPAKVEGGQKSSTPVSSLDFLPTFAKLSGAQVPEDLVLDGTSFLPALEPNGVLEREKPLLWIYYRSYTGTDYLPTVAMRDGNMKVRAVLNEKAAGDQVDENNIDQVRSAIFESVEIFDLSEDPEEKEPLSTENTLLPYRLWNLYREVLKDSHVWPAVEGEE